ncbi:MAG: DUF2764 domain-containing protein [Bacteroidaceae bacterium]|nr:DUF2764 domain-containing protein [Bacteroidaceae bacterium]
MGNYYCMMAGLPDITLDSKVEIGIPDLREEIEANFSERDMKLIFYFFLENDCKNLVKLLKNPEAEIDPDANFSLEQQQDLITSAREINFNVHRYPAFMSIFARNYIYNNKDVEGYYPEDEMQLAFYEYAMKCPNKMISNWYKLNLNINNILTAMIARKNGWDVADFIKGDNEVTEMIRTYTSKDFDLGYEIDYMKELTQIVDCEDPVEKEKKIDAFKWIWLEEQTFFDVFSVEAVFAYLCKLNMLKRWEKLDVEQGQATFRQIIEDLRGEAKVPEEFTIYMK